MLSARCSFAQHKDCSGFTWFGNIQQPPSTWQQVDCRCLCHKPKPEWLEEGFSSDYAMV